MDRTIPSSGTREIDLYLRTYYSLLRSSREVPIKSFIEAHKRVQSALHTGSAGSAFDGAAFTYAILRLPDCMDRLRLIIMGQSEEVFRKHGFSAVESWQQVSAPARRRRSFYNGHDTLAVYIASRSDIDDLVPILTAYQIERAKLHGTLKDPQVMSFLDSLVENGACTLNEQQITKLAALTSIDYADLERLARIWQQRTIDCLLAIREFPQQLHVRSLAGSFVDYKRATRRWWRNVERQLPHIELEKRPAYFVSSNTHTLANLLSGFTLQREAALEAFIDAKGSADLRREYQDILARNIPSSRENFLYYVLKKYEQGHAEIRSAREKHERQVGIWRVPSEHAFDIEVQVVELNQLQTRQIDSRLCLPGIEALTQTDALIVNIDYPLGMAAYQILAEVGRNIGEMRGVFIMGKAGTLNGQIGDVMIPAVVHDEHSTNTYLFNNCFTADDVAPHLVYGTVLDNQKAITVPGTFLQNQDYMSVFYEEGYTDIEMEAGPYLSCVYEMMRPKRHPHNEIVNLQNAPFPVGIMHYVSDTPFSKATNLGSQNLSYFGMDATYATMVAILRTIIGREIELADFR